MPSLPPEIPKPQAMMNFTAALEPVPACGIATLGEGQVWDDLAIPNGLAWNGGIGEFDFIDSPTLSINRSRWDRSTGALRGKMPLVVFDATDGSPDGMTIDEESYLWVAFWGGGCVRRIDPLTGKTCGRIELPVSRVTSRALGGPDYRTLFVTTTAMEMDDARRTAEPLAGSVFAIRPGARGLPPRRFSVSRHLYHDHN